jgi:hypothetical protein
MLYHAAAVTLVALGPNSSIAKTRWNNVSRASSGWLLVFL